MKLTPDTLNTVRVTMVLIQQHEVTVQALRNHLNSLIKDETGVDVGKGAWELDPETGALIPHTETNG